MGFPAVAYVSGRPFYHTIGFLSIGILHKNSCENLLNLPLDKKLGAPGPFARRPIIPWSFGIVNRQNVQKNLPIFGEIFNSKNLILAININNENVIFGFQTADRQSQYPLFACV